VKLGKPAVVQSDHEFTFRLLLVGTLDFFRASVAINEALRISQTRIQVDCL
jgi:hypothetical protein